MIPCQDVNWAKFRGVGYLTESLPCNENQGAVGRWKARWGGVARIRWRVHSLAKSCNPAWGIRWWSCQNGFYRPVLKHGPRSLPIMRVLRWRNLNAYRKGDVRCKAQAATSTNLDSLKKDLSKSIIGRTRKMVNYGWIGRSQGKLWWRLEAVLTCKSFVKFDCRGERLIEPSSSWFPLKFLSG